LGGEQGALEFVGHFLSPFVCSYTVIA
jgi:hypothetical protein